MKLAIFGLTISSSWGNGHATLWRGLCRTLAQDGHQVTFFERDVHFYAGARDLWQLSGGALVLYPDWESVEEQARAVLDEADAAIITSYCPDALSAENLLAEYPVLKVFYDLDTPVTLATLARRETTPYIGPRGLEAYDLVLSYTGGPALDALRQIGARRVAPLYGHADPLTHRPVPPSEIYRADLSYLGTYAPDRQAALEELLVSPARQLPERRFVIGGAQYPHEFPWTDNIHFVRHMPPPEHAAFFSSSRLTLNVTRRDMAQMGWCPSGRLFEAAACGTPIISDHWPGIEEFFVPGREILLAQSAGDVIAAMSQEDESLKALGEQARARLLAEHSSQHRAREMVSLLAQGVPAGRVRRDGAAVGA